ncbi:hypothetical protein OCH239_11805 [Roseivivax halodurans JCM 10272]|uniref:DUF6455 domain-containing protein n=1 Tax=Roseivivax halodurans JCM 10272 TaxID=1449350 RepID=X7EJ12_9RHOB|nr:DUF6455 family protein [Roseivivax halodurans]ETX15860.1 hypothetical protein OCH239_11805 [Roseivivax halodurans JCM 10272]
MLSRTVLKRHATLVDRMAQAVGVDLEEAALGGKVSIPEIDDAVLSCTGCTRSYACESWLAESNGPRYTPPTYCRNVELFLRLQAD